MLLPLVGRADEPPTGDHPPKTESAPAHAAIPTRDGFIPPPKRRLVLSNLFVLRLNPMGVENQMRIGYQQRLLERTSPLLRDTFFFAGIAPKFNPAFVKFGPSIEIQPASIFNLRLAVEYIGYFSTLGFLQSFDSALAAYDDRTLRAGQDAKRNYATGGLHVMIEPTIMLKFGPVVFRDKLALEYWLMDVRAGDRVFYEITLDTLVPARGWVLTNDLDLLYQHPDPRYRFTLGLRYSIVKPLYTDGDYKPGDDRGLDDNEHQRIGPFFAYTFFDKGYVRFNKPTLLVIANWYLDSRYRQGQADSALVPGAFVGSKGVPYVILGFAFQSDFLRAR